MSYEILFYLALLTAVYPTWRIFRDLGDITQMFMKVERETILNTIRWEWKLVGAAAAAITTAALCHFILDAGNGALLYTSATISFLMIGFPLLWVHVGLRNQQHSANFYSIEEARNHVRPETSVIVIENDGAARAHPDYEVWRPHLIGTREGLAGENIILTYCALTHLGQGFKAQIDGTTLELEVLAQTGNNLVMRDNTTMEPIQQLHGFRTCDGDSKAGMAHWPTYRMTFRTFQKAYPSGEVFLNRITPFMSNPFLWIFDHFVDALFYLVVSAHDRSTTPAMPTIGTPDPRLQSNTYVWGVNINDDYVAYTEEFVREHGIINTSISNRRVILAYDETYESLGIWYNDFDLPIQKIDFWGNSELGSHQRVETVRPGAYWCVWAHYFPNTAINRADSLEKKKAA